MGSSCQERIPMTLTTFFALQIFRITSTPTLHATGPKRPDLSTLESGKKVT